MMAIQIAIQCMKFVIVFRVGKFAKQERLLEEIEIESQTVALVSWEPLRIPGLNGQRLKAS